MPTDTLSRSYSITTTPVISIIASTSFETASFFRCLLLYRFTPGSLRPPPPAIRSLLALLAALFQCAILATFTRPLCLVSHASVYRLARRLSTAEGRCSSRPGCAVRDEAGGHGVQSATTLGRIEAWVGELALLIGELRSIGSIKQVESIHNGFHFPQRRYSRPGFTRT